jgi:glycosyltransferase involved in cell wall biosynthesis
MMGDGLRVALVSPYHGGSHRAWAEGYAQSSGEQVALFTLPARFWKWRMHGGAVALAQGFAGSGFQPDVILATDMLDLTTFLALTRGQTAVVPTLLYMHENQLTYPLPKNGRSGPMRRQHGERDLHYVFINYASMLAADGVLFNSHYHLESWFATLPRFLKHFPDHNLPHTIADLRAKSQTLPVGLNLADLGPPERLSRRDAPLILWNQRWEYDKNPEAFFAALLDLAAEGVAFEVALCGEQFGKRPFSPPEAIQQLGSRVVHVGHLPREQYRDWLWAADLTISTAHHEFFGISILEAVACCTFPLLPRRLSYPELIPLDFHDYCLYEDEADLRRRLRHALTHQAEIREWAARLATAVRRYDWPHLAPEYDRLLRQFVARRTF